MRMFITFSGPVFVGFFFLLLVYRRGQPQTFMFVLTVLSLLLAIGVAYFAVRKYLVRPRTFWTVAVTSLVVSLVMACAFVAFWAMSEEFYIFFFKEPPPDME